MYRKDRFSVYSYNSSICLYLQNVRAGNSTSVTGMEKVLMVWMVGLSRQSAKASLSFISLYLGHHWKNWRSDQEGFIKFWMVWLNFGAYLLYYLNAKVSWSWPWASTTSSPCRIQTMPEYDCRPCQAGHHHRHPKDLLEVPSTCPSASASTFEFLPQF